MNAPTWTEEQRKAITSPTRSLLVSAAAGSGKTSVLADRCVWLVCDAPEPCDIDQLLVVTFTRAAASEMRDRICARLRQRAHQSDDPRVEHQLRIVDRATISTLDSFCAALVREHFVAASVDPNFTILDEDEARLLRLEAGQLVIDTSFTNDRQAELHRLLRIHFSSDESRLISSIIHVHNVLTSIVEPDAWLDQQLSRLSDPAAIDEAIARFYEPIEAILADAPARARKAAKLAQRDPKLSYYVECSFELAVFCERLLDLVRTNCIDKAIDLAKVPPKIEFRAGSTSELKHQIKSILEPLRDALKPDGEIGELFAHSPTDLKNSVAEIAPRLRLFIELVRDFEKRYSAAKRSVRSLDFADVARAALKLLQSDDDPKKPSQLARSLHRRFRHVLVDECQDNSPIQDAILRLVSTESISQIDNLCISNLFSVGDVKQSIYEFRLANPSQFIARSDELAAIERDAPTRGAMIPLQKNFRSRGPLLDALNEIFSRLMTRESAGIDYDDKQKLHAGRAYAVVPNGFTGKPIELHVIEDESKAHHETGDQAIEELDSSETEAHLIAHRIHQLMGWNGGPQSLVIDETDPARQKHRPIQLGDIAILLRSARGSAGALAGDLRQRGVPVHVENAAGFFEAIEVLDVLSLLSVADNPTRDIPLAALIRSPFSGISEPESLMTRARLLHPDVPFHQAVLLEKDSDSFRNFFSRIDNWRSILRDKRLDLAIQQIVDESGYLNWLSGLRDGAQRIVNVQELICRARSFSNFERQGVSRFIRFLHELEEEKDLDLPAAASQSRNVVRIMTVHKSKGLEFPVVIVPDLGRLRNRSSLISPVLIDRDAGLGIHAYEAHRHVKYPSLFHRLVSRSIDYREVAEELRILYVALTRAREHLILIGTGGNLEAWREDWNDDIGPLPAKKIRSAQTMLDRLGPVAVMVERDAPGSINIIPHSPSEIAVLPTGAHPTKPNASLDEIARLAPIKPAPTISSSTNQHFNALNHPYRFELLSQTPSASAVTKIQNPSIAERATSLARPRFSHEASALSAADRGLATHVVFQHLDYRRLSSADEIRAQLHQLIDRQILNESDSSSIDIDSILWFAQTDLCHSMIAPQAKLLRELPIYMAMPAGHMESPMDQLLFRGRIDLVMIDSNGLATVIDFKSDRLKASDVDARAAKYLTQLLVYRDAIARLLKHPTNAKLVFLGAKRVFDIESSGVQ